MFSRLRLVVAPQGRNSTHNLFSCRSSPKQQLSDPLQALNGNFPRKDNVVYLRNGYDMLLLGR